MATYSAPLRDIYFVLHELLDIGQLSPIAAFEAATRDVVDAALKEAAKLCERVLFPLNRSGDEEGCHFENGVVRTPSGFKDAYRTFAEGGWTSLACDSAHGGQGLPEVVNCALTEMACSSNLAFETYVALSHAAYVLISAHGSDEIKRMFLPRLVDGRWSGTMCLTEPHCGSDLGLIRTKAQPQPDSSYRLTGTKIFISAGEHDLTENILHLVLARLPESPPGTIGLSLFLVPKFLVNSDGSLGPRNGVSCGSLEKKMGINASATCAMNFEDATGYLIGKRRDGLRSMRTMMNAARLAVGLQGLGLAETAYQSARAYARERLQGRAINGAQCPDRPADPIIVHPDVRRMLLTMKAYNEGARALAYWVGMHVDLSRHHPDPAAREIADDLVQLLIPVVKAFVTDYGFEATNLGLQVFGGHGYIREHGMEQLVRDGRIGQLYEGTNGIQALDLAGHKIAMKSGRLLRHFFDPIDRFINEHRDNTQMQEFVLPLAKAFRELQQVTAWIRDQRTKNRQKLAAAANDYLRLFGLVALGSEWAKIVKIAHTALANTGEKQFYEAKIATARFYMQYLLPQSSSLVTATMSGSGSIMELDAEAF
jgi:alkylation response protein AidB-like acyl-CoA dehydrogenase